MTSDTTRRSDELRHTEDLLETSQSIIQNFKFQREAALKKQQHVMKTLKSMNFNPVSTGNLINTRHSPNQHSRDPYSTPPIDSRTRHISSSYLHGSNSVCEEINYPSSRAPSRIYSPTPCTPFSDPFCHISEHMGYNGFYERHPVTSPLPNNTNIISNSEEVRYNPNNVYSYSAPTSYIRPKSVISDYHTGSQFPPHYENEMQYKMQTSANYSQQLKPTSDQKSNIDSQTLIRLLTGPRSNEEIEILKELARREGFNDDVIAKLSDSQTNSSSATKSSNGSSTYSLKMKKFQDSDKDNDSSSSDLSISSPKNVNGRMRFRVGSLSTSLDCDDSSVVSSLPTTERTPSSERNKSMDKTPRRTNESSRKNKDKREEHPKEIATKNESVCEGQNSKELEQNETIVDEDESDPEENSILSPLPKKSKCLDNVSSDDGSSTLHETREESKDPIASSILTKPSPNPLLCNGVTPYKFTSAASGEINETTDEEASTPKSFNSGSGSHSSASTGYKIQSVASKDRNPFSFGNPSYSPDIGGIWTYLKDYNTTNKICSSVSSVSKEEEEQGKEEALLNVDNLTGFEAEKMNDVLKLSKREKQLNIEIEKKVSGIRLLENILKETTEKALSEQRQLTEFKKERRELRKQRKTIFSELSNQPLSESEMPESVRKSSSRVSPLNLTTCDSDPRPTPSYPMNRRTKEDERNGVRFDDDLQSDRTDVLLLKPCYEPMSKYEDSSDSGTLSDQSTVKLNFGDTTVRDIIERVIEAESQIKSDENKEEPLQSDLQRLMQEYLSEMAAHESLQKELRDNIPNYDGIEKSITEQVHQLHIQAKQEMKESFDNAGCGHLSDVLSSREPPISRPIGHNKSQQDEDCSARRADDSIHGSKSQRENPSCSDDALFNNLQRQYTFLKDIKPKPISNKDDQDADSHNTPGMTSKTLDLKEIQANVLRLMNSSTSEASTPTTTQRSDIINHKSTHSAIIKKASQNIGDQSVVNELTHLNYSSSSDYRVNSGCSSAPTSDLLKRVVSEGFLNLSSDTHKDKSRRPNSRSKRPRSRRSIDPEKSATLKKYLHASSSSDLTDFDSPRLSIISKDYYLKRAYVSESKSFIVDRPSSAAGRIQES